MDQSTARTPGQTARRQARIAGVFYLATFVAGLLSLLVASGRAATGLIAAGSYIIVTLLLFVVLKPVNKMLSAVAAGVSLAGCVAGALGTFRLVPAALNPLAFFGIYCLLIGLLIFRSTFMPRALGLLMAFGGLGWLTFAAPPLARALSPYNFAPGMIGEAALTFWLLVFGVDSLRWEARR